jgi:AAA domain
MAEVDIRAQLGLAKNEDLFKYLNILIYGEPNEGKTYLAATAQDVKDMCPVLHLGFEQGLQTVAFRKAYDKREIRTIGQLEKVVELLQNDLKSGKPHYKTIIIDNATELQSLDIETVMRETKATSNNPDRVDIDVPSPREWGKIGKRLRRAVIGIRDLEMHTIWTAWRGEFIEKDAKGDPTGPTHYYPKLSGFMKSEFNGYFDIVGMLRTKETNGVQTRILQVAGTARTKAKWRNRNVTEVPDFLEAPSIPMIWEGWKKSVIVES